MILGSVFMGVLVGLSAALFAMANGQSPAIVLLYYGLSGSIGTLVFAAMTVDDAGHRSPLMR